ncbi:MAG: Ig-like domain-containing protein, partial [Anaerolineales bacterium]|nr:Ig-like domain-containing protein [Anaerolineales bacterium]
ENSGTTAYDLSGLGHHGTISGAAYNTSTFTADEIAPTISSVSLDADNLTIAVTMSEAVYNTNGGSGALEASDFALSISGGAATLSSATPTSISISGNVYTLGIGLSGIANGNETITVKPMDNSIYDAAGNEASTSQSNNTASLNAIGKSLSFDGTNDYVDIGSQLDIAGDFTIEAHIKISNSDDPENVYTIYSKSDATYSAGPAKGYMLEVYKGVLHFGHRTDNGGSWSQVNSTISIDYNQWYNVAVTRTNDDIQLFIDGVAVGSGTFSDDITFPSSVNTYIGRFWMGDGGYPANYHFEGFIDEVGIWNEGLTSAEITALYNSGTALDARTNSGDYASTANLKGYWKFEEGTGTTLTDLSGNGNNGTISGATWATGKKSSSYTNTAANDITAPTISSVSLDADNLTIAVTMSEAVYNTNGGSGALEASDFALSISGGAATLSSSTPTSISISGNVYTLGIGLSGIANGSETLTVTPVDDGIYDAAGNEASTSQSNNTASLNAIGESLSFDGSNDYVDCGTTNIPDVDDSRTLTAWINANELSGDQGIIFTGTIGTNDMFTMALLAANPTKISVWGYNHDVTGSTVLSTGIWYHIAITYNALDGELKSYINGAIDINTTTTDYTTSLGTVEIGRAGTDEFNGKIDEIGIWNEALTSAEITALYNSGVALDALSNSGNYTSTSNLVGYWKMEEGTGTTLTDLSGNGNNGTISGATWATGKKSSSYTNTTKDNTAPTMTITAAEGVDGFTSKDATLALTFTSSEATTDFAEEDITITNGALSDFAATSSTVYTATLTPTADGAATIDVAASTFTDAAGNNNTAAAQFNWTYDGTSPASP